MSMLDFIYNVKTPEDFKEAQDSIKLFERCYTLLPDIAGLDVKVKIDRLNGNMLYLSPSNFEEFHCVTKADQVEAKAVLIKSTPSQLLIKINDNTFQINYHRSKPLDS